MRFFKRMQRCAAAMALAAAQCSLGGCGSLSSSIDQAYYTGGDTFSIPGGYTRTIFSPSNF